jgi:hypothetical protein
MVWDNMAWVVITGSIVLFFNVILNLGATIQIAADVIFDEKGMYANTSKIFETKLGST